MRHETTERILSAAVSVALVAGLVPTPALAEALEATSTEEQVVAASPDDESIVVTSSQEGQALAGAGDLEGAVGLEDDDSATGQGQVDGAASSEAHSTAEQGNKEQDGTVADEADAKGAKVVSLLSAGGKGPKDGVPTTYVDLEGNHAVQVCTLLKSNTGRLTEEWYCVQGEVNKTDVYIPDDAPDVVNIILSDGSLLKTNGVSMANGKTLRIWAGTGEEEGGLGKLKTSSYGIRVQEGRSVEINGGIISADTDESGTAGIGGKDGQSAGNITINGGDVKAWGTVNAAGIGGGNGGKGGNITINGGKVWAKSDDEDGAGIGGGEGKGGGNITINGGEVEAYGSESAAGIGAGFDQDDGLNNTSVTINGGTVKAVGGDRGAGIGCGEKGSDAAAQIKIGGGTVVAQGSSRGAGIGGGDESGAGTIEITGGDVTATGGDDAAGIGSGDNSNNEYGDKNSITITGGKVTAKGGGRGAGIGGGEDSPHGGIINITGGDVEATGGERGAGIGGGDEGGGGTINIGDFARATKSTVKATGGKFAAGIGSGDNSNEGHRGGTITITGNVIGKEIVDGQEKPIYNTNVIAKGGEDGAGIGGGDWSDGLEATIIGAYVETSGSRRGAGIGGSCDGKAGKITIAASSQGSPAYVTAASDYAAGIGTGAADLLDSDPDEVRGGTVDISNSYVIAASAMGGAGIGGGIFGSVDSISIRGGTVSAQGGAMIGAGTISTAFMLDKVLEAKNRLLPIPDFFTFGPDLIVSLFAEDPDILFYTGAGIGGGYKAPGGKISISDDATIQAVAGMLPPNKVLKEAVEKQGIDFEAPPAGWHSYAIGDGAGWTNGTTLNVYQPSLATTLWVDLEIAGKNPESPTGTGYDFNTVKSDMSTMAVNGENISTARQRIMSHNYAVLQPMPQGAAGIDFDPNADGATGTMEPQVAAAGTQVQLKANAYGLPGHCFMGWNTKADGTGESYADGDMITVGQFTLYAQWEEWKPVAQLLGHTLTLDGRIAMNTYLVFGPDVLAEPDRYQCEYWHDDKLVAATRVSEARDGEREGNGTKYEAYCFPVTSVAKNADDKLEFKIKDLSSGAYLDFANSDGAPVFAESGLSYSIVDYLDDRIENSNDDHMKRLARDLKAYHVYAKHYFAVRDGSEEMLPEVDGFQEVSAADLDKYASEQPEAIGHFAYKGSTLELLSDTSYRMYFESDDASKLTITCDGKALTPISKGDGTYYVELGGISAQQVDTMYDIVVMNDDGDKTTVHNGPLGYARWALSTDASGNRQKEALQRTMMALYHYNQSAKTYLK